MTLVALLSAECQNKKIRQLLLPDL